LSKRLRKVERILAVQEKLHRLAEWKLARIEEKQAGLSSERQSLVDALNGDDRLQGLFVEAMAKRLAVLARETDRVNHEREEQVRLLFAEALRLGRTERMTEKLRRQHGEELWKRSFRDILESVGRKRDASFP
jgi:hypothetical protein